MKNSQTLLMEMEEELDKQAADIRLLSELSEDALNQRPQEKAWSALECFAHLNSYARYYVPAFKEVINHAKTRNWKAVDTFQSTWIGRYSIKSILPENRNKKLSSPKQHNHFASSRNKKEDIAELLKHIDSLKALVYEAKEVNLNKARVAIEIMPFLKLRLGDFFPFLIYHQSRHLLQAKEAAALNV